MQPAPVGEAPDLVGLVFLSVQMLQAVKSVTAT